MDFPSIFAGRNGAKGGFDIIVGNPPFVTARNPEKRELWRERWPTVCEGKYHMLCPFFALGLDLLRADGELGFIVSNAFAKRDFGRPLIENLFSNVDLQKILDCSGLAFPGHGTPTCLIFLRNAIPSQNDSVAFVGILPGGGDLRLNLKRVCCGWTFPPITKIGHLRMHESRWRKGPGIASRHGRGFSRLACKARSF